MEFIEQEYYLSRFKKFGVSPKSLDWSISSQLKRFEFIEGLIEYNKISILDIGAGFGDLFFYLSKTKDIDVYCGLEPIPLYCSIANDRLSLEGFYPESHQVLNCKLQDYSSEYKYDYAIAIGTYNLRFTNNEERLMDEILFAQAKASMVIISMTSSASDLSLREKSPSTYFYDEHLLGKMLNERAIKYRFCKEYLPHDMTLVIGER